MAIDRIGKSGGIPQTSPEIGAPEKVGASFEVARPSPVQGVQPTSPLARLQAGEIDVNRYVDLKVDEATAGLRGLDPADLADVKQVLRDQLVMDPELADLVTHATGGAATLPDVPPEE